MNVADGAWSSLPDMAVAWVTAAPWVLAWMLSAAGLGRVMAHHLGWHGPTAACALGACLMLVLEQWAGTAGLLARGIVPAMALLTPGWWLLARTRAWPSEPPMPWAASLPVGLACGVMLAAIAVPPGFLWHAEFGGYDALSYHLQLPKSWIEAGSIRPLPHAAYSGFPSFLEAAFMHLMALRQDPRDAAVACQMLHATLMLTAACMLGRVATRAAGSTVAGAVTVAAAMGTPWLLVTGSLPYSESGVLLGAVVMLGACITQGPWRMGLALGLGAAVAVGSKASSAVLVVPGGVVAWLVMHRSRPDARTALAGVAAAALALAPWLLRNAWHTGDPLFPLGGATTAGWWTAEQAARWNAAHGTTAPWLDRLHALWRQGPLFGLGPNPSPGEPWQPLWGVLPWVGVMAWVTLGRRGPDRRWSLASLLMTAFTLVGWLAFTHLQSRFLIPAVAPLALVIGVWAARLAERSRAWQRGLVWSGVAWGLLAVWTCLRDFDGALRLSGQVALASGDLDLALLQGIEGDEAAAEVRARPSVEVTLGNLFPGQRTLAVGWSVPFWVRPGAPVRWSTVWDTNPMETALAQPDARAWLQERYDLVLVDWPMLDRWQRSGWLAKGLDPARVADALRGLDRMGLAGEREIFSLRGPLRPTWPAAEPR